MSARPSLNLLTDEQLDLELKRLAAAANRASCAVIAAQEEVRRLDLELQAACREETRRIMDRIRRPA